MAVGVAAGAGRPDLQELIKDFMSQRKFAVVGATDDTGKYGNTIYRNLKKRGYEVFPVNPKLDELEGSKCYRNLADIPEKVDVVDFVVPPVVTEKTLPECHRLGLHRIWLQPGAESRAAIDYCRQNGMQVVHDVCVMMN
jgi:predicted CoA-binding protein